MKCEKILTGTQAKAADTYAISTMGISSLDLMANASLCTADYIFKALPGKCLVYIFCGVGNNGADGLNIARIIKEKGYSTIIFVCGTLEKATKEFSFHLEKIKEAGDPVLFYNEMNKEGIREFFENDPPKIVVDAVFGIGLHRYITGQYKEFIDEINQCINESKTRNQMIKTIAVDIPSGINADTGELMGTGIKADLTITFGCMKKGLLEKSGEEYSGKVELVDIGIPEDAYEKALL